MGKGTGMKEKIVLHGRGVVEGTARGTAMVSTTTIQGWSGVDSHGVIMEKGHPFEGRRIQGAVLVLLGGKGSTGWATHIHQAMIAGTGPAAMVFPRMDSRTAAAAVLAGVPVVTDLDQDPFRLIHTGDQVTVDGTRGIVEVISRSA
jgi:predicted aconitase with swiveling domain